MGIRRGAKISQPPSSAPSASRDTSTVTTDLAGCQAISLRPRANEQKTSFCNLIVGSAGHTANPRFDDRITPD
jgi:hypothetical protein